VTPKRIQRKRTKGYRLPPDAVYVGRPTQWGNPFTYAPAARVSRMICVTLYRNWVTEEVQRYLTIDLAPLRGHDLACWCPLDQPCHADVLLELANATGEAGR